MRDARGIRGNRITARTHFPIRRRTNVRPNAKTASLVLAAVLAAACDPMPPEPPPMQAALVPAGTQLIRPEVDVTAWPDLSATIPIDLVTPQAAGNIGTGSAIIIEIPDEGRFG